MRPDLLLANPVPPLPPLGRRGTCPDGSLVRRVEPVWTLKDLAGSGKIPAADLPGHEGRQSGRGWKVPGRMVWPPPRPLPGFRDRGGALPEYGSGVLRPRARRSSSPHPVQRRPRPPALGHRVLWEAAIKRFVVERGPRDLDRRSLRFWGLYFGLPHAETPAARSKGREWGGAGL